MCDVADSLQGADLSIMWTGFRASIISQTDGDRIKYWYLNSNPTVVMNT